MELIKANVYYDNQGKFNKDDFFQGLVDEGIVGSLDDIKDNGNGTYTIVTEDGYIFNIIIDENEENIEIEYVGKGEVTGIKIVDIKVINKTENSIEIEVETTNGEGAKYSYSYKKQGDSDYTSVATNITDNSYKFNNLQANVEYTILVQAEKDGTTVTKTINVSTNKLQEVTISFGQTKWENGKASVTVSVKEPIMQGYRLEYRIGENGNWTEISSGSEIPNLELNTNVYARVTDGINETEYATTKIEDTVNPTITLKKGTITTNSIEIIVEASDNESGLATSGTYEYFLDGISKKVQESNTYMFEGLAQGKEYTIKVSVTDKAGNDNEAEIKVKTDKVLATKVSELIEGDFVKYQDAKGNEKTYAVLYDNSSGYGVQIVMMDTIEDVTLGVDNNLDATKAAYEGAIQTLYDKANGYLNTTYATSARCIGSIPNSPLSGSGTTSEYQDWIGGTITNKDTNYEKDTEQMKKLGIIDIDKNYWLSSRSIYYDTKRLNIGMNIVDTTGWVNEAGSSTGTMFSIESYDGTMYSNTMAATNGLRPVFTLISDKAIVRRNR